MAVTYTKRHCVACQSSRGVVEFHGLCAVCYQDNRKKLRLYKFRWCRFCGGPLVFKNSRFDATHIEGMYCWEDACDDARYFETRPGLAIIDLRTIAGG